VTAEDLRGDKMAKLQKALNNADGAKFLGIPDLVKDGGLRPQGVAERLREVCGQAGKTEVDCEYTMRTRDLRRRLIEAGATASPEKDNEFSIVEMPMPALPMDSKARASTLKDTGETESCARLIKHI
jgi:hypothetical protein